jgi:hypothetical protein
MIHWILRNRWLNCDELTKHIFFIMSHIYREDNQSTNDIATRGLQTHDSQWWDTIHNNINNPFTRNRLGLTRGGQDPEIRPNPPKPKVKNRNGSGSNCKTGSNGKNSVSCG